MKKQLNDSLTIRNTVFKNRICAGPMGPTTRTDTGLPTAEMISHFSSLAANQAGMILQGAMCVSAVYLARNTQMGLYSDETLEGLCKITEGVHAEDGKILIQLEHPGMRSSVVNPPAPSAYTFVTDKGSKECHVLTKDDIEVIVREYKEAAERTVKAGYDGIEIHASHGWLPDNFLNPCVNQRDDIYGQDRTLLIREIHDSIRNAVPDSFIIGIRIAGFNPHLQDGISNAKAAEQIGYDFVDISNNPVISFMPQKMYTPEGYPLSGHIYSAGEIKKAVKIPVFGGKEIRNTMEAEQVLDAADIDMVMIARGFLCDPLWAVKAFNNGKQIECRHCSRCTWELGGKKCAAIMSACER